MYVTTPCMLSTPIYSRSPKKVPVSVPFTSVLTVCRRQTLGMNSSAKFTACRWRSIAQLFSTTRSRDGFFLPREGLPAAPYRALHCWGACGASRRRERSRLYFLRFIIECTTSLGSLLVATDSPFLLQAT